MKPPLDGAAPIDHKHVGVFGTIEGGCMLEFFFAVIDQQETIVLLAWDAAPDAVRDHAPHQARNIFQNGNGPRVELTVNTLAPRFCLGLRAVSESNDQDRRLAIGERDLLSGKRFAFDARQRLRRQHGNAEGENHESRGHYLQDSAARRAVVCYDRAGMARATHWIGIFAAAAALLAGEEPLPRKLVQFTVVALDGKGKPITDLREDELSITEDGQARTIASFRFEGGPEPYRAPCARGFFTNGSGCHDGLPRNIVATAPDSSLESLQALAAHIAALAGRKSILWPGGAGGGQGQARAVAERLASMGVSVYPAPGVLADLFAKVTGGRAVEHAAQAQAIAANDLAGAYTLGFFEDGEPDGEWHGVEVILRRRGAQLTYREGYLREKPANRSWSDSQWARVMSESVTGATLTMDARCELVPGEDSHALTCTLQIPDSKVGFLPVDGQLRGEVETALVEKMPGGTSQVQQSRSPFRVSGSLSDSLDSHATQLVAHWKIGKNVPLVRLIVRDSLSENYGVLDIPVDKIPPPHSSDDEETEPAPLPPGADPFIEKAREVALNFLKSLPNYIVKENLSRERQSGNPGLWSAKDRIAAEVVYEAGKETTRDVTLNGRPANVPLLEATGTWSTGQFAGTLKALFDRQSNATFRERGWSKIGGREARVYDYSIERVNSAWMLSAGTQTYVTAYHGTVWLERDTARTLRFEMKARGIPGDFPFDRAESSTTFGMVQIGSRPYLMPENSVALVCTRIPGALNSIRRGTRIQLDACSRNVILFSGYRQFGVESNITFGPGR